MTDRTGEATYGRFAILLLAAEWIIFGSMHFSEYQKTVTQVPDFFHPFQGDIVVITGIWEVATGILLLLPETRRYAAYSSVALLIALFPAMYKILYRPDLFGDFLRVALMPNNILLAICSVYILRNPHASLAPPAGAPRQLLPVLTRSQDVRPVKLLVPLLLLIANCAGFAAVAMAVPGRAPTAALWAMACIASGALIGFIFGVPRINPAARQQGQLLHNPNIEAVSDWLTKILVGVGLVNFHAIGGFTDRLARQLGEALAAHSAFATGLITYFFVVGIIQGYILTRLFLKTEFEA